MTQAWEEPTLPIELEEEASAPSQGRVGLAGEGGGGGGGGGGMKQRPVISDFLRREGEESKAYAQRIFSRVFGSDIKKLFDFGTILLFNWLAH